MRTATRLGFLLSAGMVLVACGSDDAGATSAASGQGGATPALGPECADAPWSCLDGQTCWVATDDAWRCVAAGPAVEGAACSAVVGHAGCASGLLCVGEDPANGTCVAFCSLNDGAHACAGGAACALVTLTTPDHADVTAHGCTPKGGAGGG